MLGKELLLTVQMAVKEVQMAVQKVLMMEAEEAAAREALD